MTKDHPADAATGFLTVDEHATPERFEIESAPVPDRFAENASGIEEIVRDQRRSAERPIIPVAIVDDLDSGHDGVDPRRHSLAGERGFLRRDIAREPDDDLAFDAESAITGAAYLSMALQGRRGEDFAGAGIGNAEVGLHHRRRAADLVTHRQTEPGLAQSPVDLRLNGVGLDFVVRPQIFGKVYGRRRQSLADQRTGRGFDLVRLQHDGISCCARAPPRWWLKRADMLRFRSRRWPRPVARLRE